MTHYVVKANLGTCWVDVYVLSDASPAEVYAGFAAAGGLTGPMGWVKFDTIMAILDCAAVGIKPPTRENNVVQLSVVGGKDDARGRSESETTGLPEEPGA